MRLGVPAVCVLLALGAGCGYVGPVSPPSPQIPIPVTNLTAVERGNEIEVNFSTPVLTTDFLQIKKLSAIELRAGPVEMPFNLANWEADSKSYDISAVPEIDADDPKSVPVSLKIPVSDWKGQHIAVSVRTAVRTGDHFSQWSPPANLEVIEPLEAPKVSEDPTRDGYKLTWEEQRPGLQYEVLRQGHGDTSAVSVGISDKPQFVDSTSQWDVPYTYFVVAKKDGVESLRSQGVSVSHADTFAPTVPQGVTVLAGPDSVELTWTRSPESDLKAYKIYRGVGNDPLQPLGEPVALPTFSDRKVEHGKTYRYAISAIDNKNNESERSTVVEVSF